MRLAPLEIKLNHLQVSLIKVVVVVTIKAGDWSITWVNFLNILGPSVYLAINAEASTDNGNITKLRQLEINWYNIDDDTKENYRYV